MRGVRLNSTESRFVTGPSNILFVGAYVCTFQPGNSTSWGSEGLNTTHLSFPSLRLTVVRDDEKMDFRARGCGHSDL